MKADQILPGLKYWYVNEQGKWQRIKIVAVLPEGGWLAVNVRTEQSMIIKRPGNIRKNFTK